MRNIPLELLAQFDVIVRERKIPNSAHGLYKKWLRFYLDFCEKYHFPESRSESLAHFLRKLEEKRQTKAQQQEASRAVSLYYELAHYPSCHDEVASRCRSAQTPEKAPQRQARGP